MNAVLLAILIVGSFKPIQYDVHLFWHMEDCTEAAMILAESKILPEDYQIWCVEVPIEDGYAAWETE